MIDRQVDSARLLRRHMRQRPLEVLDRSRLLTFAAKLRGNAEVDELGHTISRSHDDIMWIDIVMGNTILVNLMEGPGQGYCNCQESIQFQWRTAEEVMERDRVEILHDQRKSVVNVFQTVALHNARTVQHACQLVLLLELNPSASFATLAGYALDDDRLGIQEANGAVHNEKRPSIKFLNDIVTSKTEHGLEAL